MSSENSVVVTPAVMQYPIGISHYRKLIEGNYIRVDKSLLIKDLIDDGPDVVLFNRPRRFGKTITMSMLDCFFKIQEDGESCRHLFANTLLAQQYPNYIEKYQGQYPVIFLTFKDCKSLNYTTAVQKIRKMIRNLYEHFQYLRNSASLTPTEKHHIDRVLNASENEADLSDALLDLSRFLHKHHRQPVLILIDEYDTPIHSSYVNGYYEEMITFMRQLLGAGLKDNPHLFKGALTGILRVSKESLFSELNNVVVYSLLDKQYGQYFGFTEVEMHTLLQSVNREDLMEKIKAWYNGYHCGDETLYNPWSILNCLHADGKCQPYWVNTSANTLLIKLLARSGSSVKSELECLLQGNSVRVDLDETMHLQQLNTSDSALWYLLLASGYLTAETVERRGLMASAHLRIPNQEIQSLYRDLITAWFDQSMGQQRYLTLLDALVNGDVDIFIQELKDCLLESASYFDTSGRTPENFYHGFILGMIVALRATHHVYSNRESGLGRYDVAILPKESAHYPLGIVMEFKRTRQTNDDLSQLAKEALTQIHQRNYETEIKAAGVSRLLTMGLAFCGKQMEVEYALVDQYTRGD